MRKKGPELVGDRRNAVRRALVSEGLELDAPEFAHLGIGDVRDDPFASLIVDEKRQHIPQIRVGLIEKRQDGVSQEMLHAGAPGVDPLLLQRIDQTRSDQRPVFLGNIPLADAEQRYNTMLDDQTMAA